MLRSCWSDFGLTFLHYWLISMEQYSLAIWADADIWKGETQGNQSYIWELETCVGIYKMAFSQNQVALSQLTF